jgi:hypothetical protein
MNQYPGRKKTWVFLVPFRSQLKLARLRVTKLPQKKVYNPQLCACCGNETMVRVLNFDFRGPPAQLLSTLSGAKKSTHENTGSKKTA